MPEHDKPLVETSGPLLEELTRAGLPREQLLLLARWLPHDRKALTSLYYRRRQHHDGLELFLRRAEQLFAEGDVVVPDRPATLDQLSVEYRTWSRQKATYNARLTDDELRLYVAAAAQFGMAKLLTEMLTLATAKKELLDRCNAVLAWADERYPAFRKALRRGGPDVGPVLEASGTMTGRCTTNKANTTDSPELHPLLDPNRPKPKFQVDVTVRLEVEAVDDSVTGQWPTPQQAEDAAGQAVENAVRQAQQFGCSHEHSDKLCLPTLCSVTAKVVS